MSTVVEAPRTTFWTMDRVADALAAHASGNLPRGGSIFGRVWTDTRTIQEGDLFLALKGERFDAHDYVKEAVAKGATGVVLSRAEAARALGVPVFQVRDTLVALGALGNYRRRVWGKPVFAVVGSNGKTSTKELIRAALGSRLEVHATTGNLNNLIGVPLTLLGIPDEADVAVIEMGTNVPGEIPRLTKIVEPNISVVTSVAEEHLEGFGDLAGVLREEIAACEGVAVAVVPAAQPEIVEAAKPRAKRVVVTGLDGGQSGGQTRPRHDSDAEGLGPSLTPTLTPSLTPTRWSIDEQGLGALQVEGVEVKVPLRGVHNLRNAMLALAVAREAGVSLEDAARGISAMSAPPMRVNVERHGSATLINDAYNSNPGSARAAIDLLQHAGKGRQRVAVLGTMLELGPQTPALHDDVARHALAGGAELVVGVGEFAAALGRVAPGDARVVMAPDVDSVWSRLSSRLAPDAVILLKGSRGMRLERLVDPIATWARDAAGNSQSR